MKTLRTKGVFIDYTTAKQLQTSVASEFERLWLWRQEAIAEVGAHYRLWTPFGRVRYFYQGRGDGPAAIDFKCQGTAADIIWSSLLAIEEACVAHGGAQLATIHDEALVELPCDAEGRPRKDAVEAIKDVMEREWPMIAPGFVVPVGVEYGPSWGEMVEWKGD